MSGHPLIRVEESSIADVLFEEGNFGVVFSEDVVYVSKDLMDAFRSYGRGLPFNHIHLLSRLKADDLALGTMLGWSKDVYARAYARVREDINPYLSDELRTLADGLPIQHAYGAFPRPPPRSDS